MERTITYKFVLERGVVWEYALKFDKSNHLVPKVGVTPKPWTKLEYHQCPNCPLKSAEHPHCPVALNLDHIVEDSKETLSIAIAEVTVDTPERRYSKKCSSQDGLRALFGLIMACSGCPHLDWLRPLARFHLPFADIDETMFRVLSLQLMDQFFNDEKSSLLDCVKKISDRYAKVEKVNHAFIGRIRNYCKADADKNAMAALDVFVQFFPVEQQNKFESLRKYFRAAK